MTWSAYFQWQAETRTPEDAPKSQGYMTAAEIKAAIRGKRG